MAPLLNVLPTPSKVTLNTGTYINSVQVLGGTSQLKTAGIPDAHDTFYAKSLMVPEAAPMSIAAINAFMSYLGSAGFKAKTVGWLRRPECYLHGLSSNYRTGFHKSNYMAVQTLLSTMSHLTPQRLLTGNRSLPFSFKPQHAEVPLLSPRMALHFLMVLSIPPPWSNI